MPLTDFVRYLNAQHPLPASGLRSTTPFVSEDGRVCVHFANLRLESAYAPIVDTASGELRGHAAELHAVGLRTRQPLAADAVFVLPSDDEEFVYLDRLVRTLHALNYLTYLNRHSRGKLLLKVHPRHVASVAADHGLAFEEILRACGLLPEQITLELEIGEIADSGEANGNTADGGEAAAHLVRAIANYKSRGYGIAVGRFGRRAGSLERDFGLLREIRPDIVKLDPLLLAAEQPLPALVERLRALGAPVMVEGLDTAHLRKGARASGIDLLQVHPPLRRLLHADVGGPVQSAAA
ncbi:MAG: EAL domain-containing protein [Candidatus Accumulibacter sp.]|nr:EAL domain-containing protein [Accumulibacter sp.]MBA4094354.1 EAL domain-containing protein [Accumulibacter sp.]